MRINTNITAMISNNALQKSENKLSKSIERLSSGYKLNHSSDDPAGCAISEKMRVQIRGLNQADNNTADGVSVLNTADGALTEVSTMLTRMKELTVQAANDVNSDEERDAIQEELVQINKEIDRISEDTEFNTQPLLNGNLTRRVYSDCQGVNQLSCSDGFVAGQYGITVTQDAREAVVFAQGTIGMTDDDVISEQQAGTITLNGYKISIGEGDNLNSIMGKLVEGADKAGCKAFVTASPDNDTNPEVNGTEYAGYKAQKKDYSGNSLVIMTKQFGNDQSLEIKCNNAELANLLGINSACSEEGIKAQGSDVKAEFTMKDGKKIGFEDSAVISTKGTHVTVKDINNKEFSLDIPSNVAGTKFNDSGVNPVATDSTPKKIEQQVTDVGTMSIHVGANENQTIKLDIPPVNTYMIGTDTINVRTSITAQHAINTVDEAISYVNAARSKIGAYTNRFEHTQSNISTSNENMTSSLSTMMDTDMAEEMTEYTTQNVVTQAATSILSQANERPSTVLQLLQ